MATLSTANPIAEHTLQSARFRIFTRPGVEQFRCGRPAVSNQVKHKLPNHTPIIPRPCSKLPNHTPKGYEPVIRGMILQGLTYLGYESVICPIYNRLRKKRNLDIKVTKFYNYLSNNLI